MGDTKRQLDKRSKRTEPALVRWRGMVTGTAPNAPESPPFHQNSLPDRGEGGRMKELKNILYDLQGACILLKTASDNTSNPASPLYCTMLARKIYETAFVLYYIITL